jgi:hypothetical protein
VIEEIARLVVVACVVVEFPVMVRPPVIVEDDREINPFERRVVIVVVGARYPFALIVQLLNPEPIRPRDEVEVSV